MLCEIGIILIQIFAATRFGDAAIRSGRAGRTREVAVPMNKPHLEFHHLDINSGWETPPGYPPGIKQKILASDLNEAKKVGSRTRLLRFEPGVFTTAPFVH